MRKSNNIVLAFLTFALLGLAACAGGPRGEQAAPALNAEAAGPAPGPETPAPSIKIALLLPLSGKHASLGQAMLNASQMALFDVGSNNFQLLPRDTGGTAQGAAQAATNAVHEGAQLILGPVFAEEVSAAKPAAAAANVNLIAFSTNWELAGGNVFIMGFLPYDQIQRVVSYAASQNVKRIGVIAPASEYGRAVLPAFQTMTAKYGVSSAQPLTIDPASSGAMASVRQYAQGEAAQIDAIFMPFGGASASSVSYALTQAGMPPPKTRRIGTGLFDDDALAANPSLDGAWFAAPAPAKRKVFEGRYMQTYGFAPPRLATLSYDATALASALAQRGLKNGGPAFTREAITNPNGFAGLDGIFRFKPNGMAERGLAVLGYANGHISVLDDAPSTFQEQTQ